MMIPMTRSRESMSPDRTSRASARAEGQFFRLEIAGGETDTVENPGRRGRDAGLRGNNIRAHQRCGSLQCFRKGFRRDGPLPEARPARRLHRGRGCRGWFRLNGVPEAMCRIGGKAAQGFIAQGFFEGFAIFIRGDMPHNNTQIGLSRCALSGSSMPQKAHSRLTQYSRISP